MTDHVQEDGIFWKEVTVQNRQGFHARPAAMMARVASQFDSDVTLIKDGLRVSAKSVMGMLGLEAAQGTVIRVEGEGDDDAEEALVEVCKLIEDGFGE